MRWFLQWLCGYVRICMKGRQVHRFLNLCSRNSITMWNITQDLEHYLRACLKIQDFYSLKPYLRKTRTKIRIISRHGFPFWCYRHPRLKWFPVLLIVLATIFLYGSTYVWDIQIEGNEKVSNEQILQYLETHRVEKGIKQKSIQCAQIEYGLLDQFDQFGWVCVYLSNNCLHIKVRESAYEPQEDMVEDNRRYDLVAKHDATIYSMVTRAGTAIVQKGATVHKGTTLVEGKYEVYNDAGEVKEIRYVTADAKILGDTAYTFTTSMSELEILSLKIAGLNTDKVLKLHGYNKINHFLENLEENGVIILDKNVMIEKNEKNIAIIGNIIIREEIGINILVEEQIQDEFDRENHSDTR